MDVATLFELLVLGVIFVGGITSNILVILGTYLVSQKKLQVLHNGQDNFINMLIINLAVADLVVLVISLPTGVLVEYISWPFGIFACKYISPVQDIGMCTSTLTFAVIAVQRYLVTKATYKRYGSTTAKWFIFLIWFLGWLLFGLPLSIYKKVVTDGDMRICDIFWPNVYVQRFFIVFALSLISMCGLAGAVSYCAIQRKLRTVKKMCNQTEGPRSADTLNGQSSAKISAMLFVLIVMYFICSFPFHVVSTLNELGVIRCSYALYIGTSCLLYSNCLVNPLAVLTMKRECRMAFAQCRKRGQRKGKQTPSLILCRRGSS